MDDENIAINLFNDALQSYYKISFFNNYLNQKLKNSPLTIKENIEAMLNIFNEIPNDKIEQVINDFVLLIFDYVTANSHNQNQQHKKSHLNKIKNIFILLKNIKAL